MTTPSFTPMIRQYLEIKQRYQDAILFFRMGDFYEMFFEDALKASSLLEIALTSRNKGEENAIPFCGVPHHSASSYIARLIQEGHKVALCEQVEDPAQAKGIVRREVVRVITPGVVFEAESLESKGNNYLVSILHRSGNFGLAYADASTGEVGVGIFLEEEALLSELFRREPREILFASPEPSTSFLTKLRQHFPKSLIHTEEFSFDLQTLLSRFSPTLKQAWEGLKLRQTLPEVEKAILRLLAYLSQSLKTELHHFSTIQWLQDQHSLVLDAATVRNLELVRNLQDGKRWSTLLDVLDQTKTAMGARRLRNWILYPLHSRELIQRRQSALQELLDQPELATRIETELKRMVDLERLNGRVATGLAHARDLLALGQSLAVLQDLQPILRRFQSPFFQMMLQDWRDLAELAQKINGTLREELPLALKEGGLIRENIHPELDELRLILRDGQAVLARMEEEERRKTGIQTLKLRYNRVFGYYIEVPQSKMGAVPAHYQRKQTLANAERYITPELKSYEEKVLGAQDRIRALEYELFLELREEVKKHSVDIHPMAQKIADLDAIRSLAQVALENRYCRPEMTMGEELEIEAGRHPVLEKLFPASRFVPNDTFLDTDESRLILLTGPNMAGKSTFLRQTALIALMAHIGSFVPAQRVRIGLIDRIFTRIGASDNLSKNQSTFWVEMAETAHILKSASQKSLIVLDEIGRGTSTYDGLSLAWSLAEHLHDRVRAKTIFATHYHELIDLAETHRGIGNFHVSVKEWQGEVLFLYQIVPGGVSQSYGIQVAKLAGIPDAVVQRAKQVLTELQGKHLQTVPSGERLERTVEQLPLFTPSQNPILEELKRLSIEEMTPLQALQKLAEWKSK